MKKLLLLLVLFASIFAAYYFVTTDSHRIDQDITARLGDALENKGYASTIVSDVSGRDVTLSGTVASEVIKADAETTAKSLYGVRAVNNDIIVAGAADISKQEEPKFAPAMDEPLFSAELEMPKVDMPEIEGNLFKTVPKLDVDLVELEAGLAVPSKVIAPEPEIELEAAVEEKVIVSSEPVITYVEEEPAVSAAPVVPEVKINGPLPVKSGRVIRREVDQRIASKTVEAACEDDLRALMWNNKILFDSAKATIQSKSYPLLDKLVVAAKNCDKNTIITINGHTDDEGDAEYNRKLSLDRARAVGKYMLKRGVAKRVKVVGHGENHPVASNDTEEGKAQNRRIEFKVFTDG
jgi:outer membrane protein OmpA-like peptidoglycan-associated protein